MYAIVETGGKQYKVQEGDTIFVEKLDYQEGDSIELKEVLSVCKEGELLIGTPKVEDASVNAKVEKHDKSKKIHVFKYKPKKGYRKKQGHRQPYTKLKIEKINA